MESNADRHCLTLGPGELDHRIAARVGCICCPDILGFDRRSRKVIIDLGASGDRILASAFAAVRILLRSTDLSQQVYRYPGSACK